MVFLGAHLLLFFCGDLASVGDISVAGCISVDEVSSVPGSVSVDTYTSGVGLGSTIGEGCTSAVL